MSEKEIIRECVNHLIFLYKDSTVGDVKKYLLNKIRYFIPILLYFRSKTKNQTYKKLIEEILFSFEEVTVMPDEVIFFQKQKLLFFNDTFLKKILNGKEILEVKYFINNYKNKFFL